MNLPTSSSSLITTHKKLNRMSLTVSELIGGLL